MHIITVSVTVSLIKNTAFYDFKEGFVNRIRGKLKKKSQKGNNFFGGGACFGG